MSEIEGETYLGDGVYARPDGYMIELWTMRGEVRHVIYLEPEVLDRLNAYAKELWS